MTDDDPLLGRLITELPEVFEAEVLSRLAPVDKTLLKFALEGTEAYDSVEARTRMPKRPEGSFGCTLCDDIFPCDLARLRMKVLYTLATHGYFRGRNTKYAHVLLGLTPKALLPFAAVGNFRACELLRRAGRHCKALAPPWPPPVAWHGEFLACAACGGNLDLVKWGVANGCPWETEYVPEVLECAPPWFDDPRPAWAHAVSVAIDHGNESVFHWLLDEQARRATPGMIPFEEVYHIAMRGTVGMLARGLEIHDPPSFFERHQAALFRDAAKCGRFDNARFLYEYTASWEHEHNACEMCTLPTAFAAIFGDLAFLEWLRERGFPWTARGMRAAEFWFSKSLALERADPKNVDADVYERDGAVFESWPIFSCDDEEPEMFVRVRLDNVDERRKIFRYFKRNECPGHDACDDPE